MVAYSNCIGYHRENALRLTTSVAIKPLSVSTPRSKGGIIDSLLPVVQSSLTK